MLQGKCLGNVQVMPGHAVKAPVWVFGKTGSAWRALETLCWPIHLFINYSCTADYESQGDYFFFAAKKKNLLDFQNQRHIGIFMSLRERERERASARARGRARVRERERKREGEGEVEGERERERQREREQKCGWLYF
jgi:hypothetical protein